MKRLVDNGILYVIGILPMFYHCGYMEAVVVSLVAFIMGLACLYVENRKIIMGILCGYVILCLCVPSFVCFLPLLLYHCFRYRIRWGLAAVLLVPWQIGRYELWLVAVLGVYVLLALLFAYNTGRLQEMERLLITQRDASMERDMLLREKNKRLLEKQDYEIYLATLKERNRIAREIHDNVGHLLTRSILQMGALGTIYKEEPLHTQLEGVNETLNQAMTSIRQSVHDLHEDAIDLKQAVGEAIKEMQEKYRVYFEYDMSRAVPRQIKYCFIAIIKEAMSNIARHSDADEIRIVLREHPGLYQMSVEDNGTAADSAAEPGIGLSNMRERVENLGGTLRIRREKGFQIFVSIQKKAEEEQCG